MWSTLCLVVNALPHSQHIPQHSATRTYKPAYLRMEKPCHIVVGVFAKEEDSPMMGARMMCMMRPIVVVRRCDAFSLPMQRPANVSFLSSEEKCSVCFDSRGSSGYNSRFGVSGYIQGPVPRPYVGPRCTIPLS